MNSNTMLWGVAILAVAGTGYYFWQRNRGEAELSHQTIPLEPVPQWFLQATPENRFEHLNAMRADHARGRVDAATLNEHEGAHKQLLAEGR